MTYSLPLDKKTKDRLVAYPLESEIFNYSYF